MWGKYLLAMLYYMYLSSYLHQLKTTGWISASRCSSNSELTVQCELWPTCRCLSVTLWIWPWYQSRARSTTSRPASRESFSCSSSFICFNCASWKLKRGRHDEGQWKEGTGKGQSGGRGKCSINTRRKQTRFHGRRGRKKTFPMPSVRQLSDFCQD